MQIQGSCLCGQVRYEGDIPAPMAAVCHCRNCQKQSGSAFSYVVVVPRGQLRIEGTMKDYMDWGDSGGVVRRSFCPQCGSPILSEMSNSPGVAAIKGGTLDNDYGLKPILHAWCDSALPWSEIPADAARFAKQPIG